MFSRSLTSRILMVALVLSAIAMQLSTGHTATAFVLTNQAQPVTGKLTIVGKVKVNGDLVDTGFALTTGSKTTTAKGSSAVVSLGKLGRVEIFPSSTVNLDFDNGSIKVKLEAGRVRISSGSGIGATISTRDGEVVADNTNENTFTADLNCGNTVVSTQTGKVELRAGGTVKQIAAGSQDSAGTATPGRCKP